jgi:hypothetical protein
VFVALCQVVVGVGSWSYSSWRIDVKAARLKLGDAREAGATFRESRLGIQQAFLE